MQHSVKKAAVGLSAFGLSRKEDAESCSLYDIYRAEAISVQTRGACYRPPYMRSVIDSL